MQTLLTLGLLGSLGIFAWGLVSPGGVSRFLKYSFTRTSLAMVCTPLVFGLLVIIGATAPPQAKQQTNPQTSQATPKLTTELKGVVKSAVDSKPSTVKQIITETEVVAYDSKTIQDATLPKGTSRRAVNGVNGVRAKTYEVTITNGAETARTLLRDVITQQAVTEVVAEGTKVASTSPPQPSSSNCNPNYSGCVPSASDVDCAGGGGNGPAYVSGPVSVIGTDLYGLDRDGDGIGCE